MRTIAAAALAGALAIIGTGSAHAADVVADASATMAPAVNPGAIHIWSGPYAGVFAGHGWNDDDATGDGDGVNGGAYAGYTWQSGKYVFGVEGDLGYSGEEGSIGTLDSKTDVFGSLRGRLGVDLNPFLLYATGGVAAANREIDDGTTSDDNTHIGWTAGAGAEATVTDNVTARVEYRYSDYGSKTYDLSTGPVSSGFDEQSVRAGIGIKF